MIQQTSLFGTKRKAAVRTTSLEAARSLRQGDVSRVQAAILRALRTYGPSTDEEIASQVGLIASPSGLRTRRAELVRAGKIRNYALAKNARGKTVTLWSLT